MGIVHVVAYIERAPVFERIAPMLARHSRLLLAIRLLPAVLLGADPIGSRTPETDYPGPGLVQDIFNNRPMNDGAEVIAIEMPYRAEDAAIVPVALRVKLRPAAGRRVVRS